MSPAPAREPPNRLRKLAFLDAGLGMGIEDERTGKRGGRAVSTPPPRGSTASPLRGTPWVGHHGCVRPRVVPFGSLVQDAERTRPGVNGAIAIRAAPPELRSDPGLLTALFEAYPSATLLVDGDFRILHVNRAGRELAGDGENPLLQRGGEALHCVHAGDHRDGCGRGPACQMCVVRGAVGTALTTGAVRRGRGLLHLRRASGLDEIHLLVSASPLAWHDQRLVVVTLEDVTEVARLRSLLPVCHAEDMNGVAKGGP